MAKQTGTNNDFLAMALIGYEAQIAKINTAIAEIQAKLGHRGRGRPRVAPDGSTPPVKRTMSAAARRRIAAAQRKRWAAVRKGHAEAKSVAKAAPKKRKLSAAARRRMAEGGRKRWVAVRKASGRKGKTVGVAS